MRRRAICLLAGVLLGPFGCAPQEPEPEPEPEVPVSDIVPGLSVRGSAYFTPNDHLVEILAHEGHVYAANSWAGLGVLRLEDDGGLTVLDRGVEDQAQIMRCTSLALHPSSDTLYCAPEEAILIEDWQVPIIQRIDLSTPGVPVFREPFEIELPYVRDLEVVGDTLLIHQFTDGLWTASIAADGGLSDLQQVPIEGNARSSAAVDDRVVSLFAEPEGEGTQLRLYDPADWTELARLSLAGPPLGLSADVDGNPRVAVALGSKGMAVVDVEADSLALARSFEPPAVVNHAAIGDAFAAAFTYSGAFTWDLHDPELRMFGFGAEGTQGEKRNGAMLHGLIHEGELLSSDWTWVERWAVEPAGEIVALDVPRGFHIQPEGSVQIQLRNPGPLAMRAELWHLRSHLFDVEVPGDAIVEVELPEVLLDTLFKDEPLARVGVRVHDPEIPSSGKPLSTSMMVLVRREADEPMPPAIGDTFPEVTFADRELEPFTLPLAEGTQTIWFTLDCALMWPELEDLAWLARSGTDLGRGTAVILSDTDLYASDYAARWSLEVLRVGLWGITAPEEVQAADAAYGDEVYDAFAVYDIPADGFTMDYVLAPDGRVRSLERMYRGAWSLTL